MKFTKTDDRLNEIFMTVILGTKDYPKAACLHGGNSPETREEKIANWARYLYDFLSDGEHFNKPLWFSYHMMPGYVDFPFLVAQFEKQPTKEELQQIFGMALVSTNLDKVSGQISVYLLPDEPQEILAIRYFSDMPKLTFF